MPVLFLWPFSGCDCRCAMCDIWQDRSRQEISPEEVARWLDDWVALGVESVVLTGGEALLNRRLWEIVELVRARGIEVSLISSGLSLHRHAANIARHLSGVTFSLDGPPAVHDQVRGVPRASDLLRRSVAALADADPGFPMRGRCAVHRRNFRFLPETVRFARELGLRKVSFIAADVSSEAFNRPGGWDDPRQQDVGLSAAELPELLEQLDRLEEECGEEFAAGFISKPAETLRTKLHGHYSAHNGLGAYPRFPCNAPWKSAVIGPDGTVRPCFFHEPYGNLRDGSTLLQIVNSTEARAFRSELDMDTDPTCKRCVSRYALRHCACGMEHHPPGKVRGTAGTWGRSWVAAAPE
ncbi:MAG: radical SAM protein [Streptomyces sp.]|nr:radical SAM protein [Streptomyces sp.]